MKNQVMTTVKCPTCDATYKSFHGEHMIWCNLCQKAFIVPRATRHERTNDPRVPKELSDYFKKRLREAEMAREDK